MSKKLILFVVVAAFAYWLLNYVKTGPIYKSDKRLDGKTVLITGGNVGIGKATAIEFAKRGAKVIIASRNLEKSEAAKEEIIRQSENKNVKAMRLDLGDFSAIQSFVQDFDKQEENLHFLINNAGALSVRGMTDYGYNQVLAINHFGPFLLTNLLLDKMKKESKSSPVRIINVSSGAYQIGAFDFEMMHQDSSNIFTDFQIYGQSKLANIYFTKELNKRLKGFDITTYSLRPGLIKSDLGINEGVTWYLYPVRYFLELFILREPLYGAQTTMYCALDDNITHLSGEYFSELAHCQLKDFANIEEVGSKIWKESVAVTENYLVQKL